MKATDKIAWNEYLRAADEMARRGLRGTIGDPLPMNMTAKAADLINEDPEAFQREVCRAAYARAMERVG